MVDRLARNATEIDLGDVNVRKLLSQKKATAQAIRIRETTDTETAWAPLRKARNGWCSRHEILIHRMRL